MIFITIFEKLFYFVKPTLVANKYKVYNINKNTSTKQHHTTQLSANSHKITQVAE